MHRLDPLHLHHAARRLGRLVAEGAMSGEAAAGALGHMVAGARGVDVAGLQARLHWTMRDEAAGVARARANAETAVRWAVRPLFAMRASKAAIEEAAGRAAGDVLAWEDIVPILADEMRRALGRRRA